MTLINTQRFGYVIVVGALLGLQNLAFSFIHASGVRGRVFNAEWVKKNLDTEHKSYLGQDSPPPYMGYPDMGAGTYSRLLPYKDWFEFNCAQRVHQNNVEHLAWTLPVFFLNGLFFPRLTAGLGTAVLAGRELYRVGYMSPEGPNSRIREYGAYLLNISEVLVLLSVSFVFLRFQFGGFVSRRRLVRYFTQSRYEVELEKVLKDIKDLKSGIKAPPVKITHSPGEYSEAAKRRDLRLKGMLPSTRFDR